MFDDEKLEGIFREAAKERQTLLATSQGIAVSLESIQRGVTDLSILAHEMDRRITRLETVLEKDQTVDDIREVRSDAKALADRVALCSGKLDRLQERVLVYGAILGVVGSLLVNTVLRSFFGAP